MSTTATHRGPGRFARPSRTRQTGLVLLLAVGSFFLLGASDCGGDDGADTATKNAQNAQQQDTVDAFRKQREAVPYPKNELVNSLERVNLRRKLLDENQADAPGYVYLVSFGKPMGYYTVKGKVSSNQSQMTSSEFELDHGSYGQSVVEAPGDDGSYGDNEPGIFFYTTEGTLVKSSLDYVYSRQPLPFNVPELNGK